MELKVLLYITSQQGDLGVLHMEGIIHCMDNSLGPQQAALHAQSCVEPAASGMHTRVLVQSKEMTGHESSETMRINVNCAQLSGELTCDWTTFGIIPTYLVSACTSFYNFHSCILSFCRTFLFIHAYGQSQIILATCLTRKKESQPVRGRRLTPSKPSLLLRKKQLTTKRKHLVHPVPSTSACVVHR